MNKLIIYTIDFLHIIFILLPIIIFFIPMKYFWITKIIILLILLTPLHWELFGDNCILTLISKNFGGFEEQQTESSFTEKYFSWAINPLFKIFKIKKTDKSINKFVYLLWIIKFLLVYSYIFFYIKCSI